MYSKIISFYLSLSLPSVFSHSLSHFHHSLHSKRPLVESVSYQRSILTSSAQHRAETSKTNICCGQGLCFECGQALFNEYHELAPLGGRPWRTKTPLWLLPGQMLFRLEARANTSQRSVNNRRGSPRVTTLRLGEDFRRCRPGRQPQTPACRKREREGKGGREGGKGRLR